MAVRKPVKNATATPEPSAGDGQDGTTTVEIIAEVQAVSWADVVEICRIKEVQNPERRIVRVFCEGEMPEMYQGTYGNARTEAGPAAIQWDDGSTETI